MMRAKSHLTLTRRKLLAAMAAAGAGLLLAGGSLRAAAPEPARPAQAAKRPNIVVILADDMGYSDIGCFGSEVQTPNLDRLAAGGIRFTQCYNTARCCPSRACLLTGLYSHQAGMGHMTGESEFPAYRGFLSDHCLTIAEALKAQGYSTLMSGKWHVGSKRPHWPCDRGFDEYYGLIGGASSYWRLDEQTLARNDQAIQPEGKNFYMTDAFTGHAVEFLDKYGRGGKPFFLYLAYTAPHWPLHAWPQDIKKYEELYKKGWDELRQARYQRLVQMGIIEKEWALSPSDAPPWESVSNKDEMAHRMAVYAAQIDRMDQGVGEVMAKLKEVGAQENTLILFLSDNGGCDVDVDRGTPGVPAGGAESFLSYGRSWANMSNTPFRRYKSQVHEGGIATPLIAYWPRGIAAAGTLNHQVVHEMDIMATCVELAGGAYPQTFHDKPITPLEGRSLAPLLRGQPPQEREPIFWEFSGDRAVRAGDWKLVAYREKGPWELYDMKADRTELNDLAGKMPQKVKELSDLWAKWASRVGVVPPSQRWPKPAPGASSRPQGRPKDAD